MVLFILKKKRAQCITNLQSKPRASYSGDKKKCRKWFLKLYLAKTSMRLCAYTQRVIGLKPVFVKIVTCMSGLHANPQKCSDKRLTLCSDCKRHSQLYIQYYAKVLRVIHTPLFCVRSQLRTRRHDVDIVTRSWLHMATVAQIFVSSENLARQLCVCKKID